MPILVGVLAVDFGNKVTNEGLLVECGKVGAQEIVSNAVQTLVVELQINNMIVVNNQTRIDNYSLSTWQPYCTSA